MTFAPRKPILLCGLAGSGKTELLAALRDLGEQVVDLERLARHRGSAFGSFPERQPSNAEFHRDVAELWAGLDPARLAWVEDEGSFLGSVRIPDEFRRALKCAPCIELAVPTEIRCRRILRQYGDAPIESLAAAVAAIRPRLGQARSTTVLEALAAGDLPRAARILLGYFDEAYLQASRRRTRVVITQLGWLDEDASAMARRILATLRGG